MANAEKYLSVLTQCIRCRSDIFIESTLTYSEVSQPSVIWCSPKTKPSDNSRNSAKNNYIYLRSILPTKNEIVSSHKIVVVVGFEPRTSKPRSDHTNYFNTTKIHFRGPFQTR